VQFAQPLETDTPLGRHVETYGNFIYGITLKVTDLDRAEAYLQRKGIGTSRPGPMVSAADPDDCFGAPYFFTTADIPNDPFLAK